ncbi:hypothetical protein VNO78_16618 [Psophocarpus tetragonolobus]|uniref:Histone chaperone domain-containing protein n=1 Tax=Psophocarpus tetragonolobus TaxID=3891 RepID=A0AAN9XKL4_PSOTE
MAEHKDPQQPTLPSKRQSDSDLQDFPSKTPKLDTQDTANDDKELQNDDEEFQNDEEDDDDDEDDDEQEEEEDTKGKGILRDDKGKGKMVEEVDDDDDDSDDDDDDSDDEHDDGSDFSDDPLAEVDLNNILPSRTRGRSVSAPGVRISDNAPNAAAAAGGNDDDSDDSDA